MRLAPYSWSRCIARAHSMSLRQLRMMSRPMVGGFIQGNERTLNIDCNIKRRRKESRRNKNAHYKVGVLLQLPAFLVARGGFELWVMRRQTKHGFNRLQTPKPDLILSHPLLTGAHGGMTSSACTPNKPDPVVIVYVTPRGQHNKHATIGHPRWLAMHHGFGRRLRMEHAHKITAMRPAPDSSPAPAH